LILVVLHTKNQVCDRNGTDVLITFEGGEFYGCVNPKERPIFLPLWNAQIEWRELGVSLFAQEGIVRKWQKESAVPGSNRRRQDYWWIRPSKSYGLPLSQPRFDVSQNLAKNI
jgi:hypothetical protein